MSRKSVTDEINAIQADSDRLARESVPDTAEYRALHETTTVAVRLVRRDAEAIAAMAAQQGVSISSLLRTWIVAGLRDEQGDSVDATLIQLERGLSRLRTALG